MIIVVVVIVIASVHKSGWQAECFWVESAVKAGEGEGLSLNVPLQVKFYCDEDCIKNKTVPNNPKAQDGALTTWIVRAMDKEEFAKANIQSVDDAMNELCIARQNVENARPGTYSLGFFF